MRKSMFSEETWAESWERRAPLIEPLVPLLMAELRPGPGERIFDVGAGLAPASIAAAAAVAPGGEVHAVDISAPVLARAQRRIEARTWATCMFTNSTPSVPWSRAARSMRR